MTEPATQSLQTSCFCQSVRGNPDSNVAHIPCLAASEQGTEPGHRGGVRDPGAGANSTPTKQGLYLQWLWSGWPRVRYSGETKLQVFLPFVYICTDNYMADLLIASKISFSFKKCQLGH